MHNAIIPYYGNGYISHSGIKGMRWGFRNGPPYPLSRDISTGHKLIIGDGAKKKLSGLKSRMLSLNSLKTKKKSASVKAGKKAASAKSGMKSSSAKEAKKSAKETKTASSSSEKVKNEAEEQKKEKNKKPTLREQWAKEKERKKLEAEEKIKNEEAKRKEDEEAKRKEFEEKRQYAVDHGTPAELQPYMKTLNDDERRRIVNRLRDEETIYNAYQRSLPPPPKTSLQKMEEARVRVQRIAAVAKTGTEAWNAVVPIINTISGSKIPIINKPKKDKEKE